jgi:hypothetical protein
MVGRSRPCAVATDSLSTPGQLARRGRAVAPRGGLQDWFVLRKESKELTEQDGLNRGFRYSAIRQKPQIVGLKEEIVAVCTIAWWCAQLNRHR